MGRHVCIRIREEIVHGVDNRRMEMLLMHVILEFRKLFVIFLYFQILKGNSMKREMVSVQSDFFSIQEIISKLPDFCPSSSEHCLEC